MTNAIRFWDRIAPKYARRPVSDLASYQRKLAITREYLTPESRVFEFGCGTGSTAIAHAPFVKQITASDISGTMLEIARGKAEAAAINNIRFEQGGIEDVATPDGSYDMVMGHSILHLLEDRTAAVEQVWRLLKPGGVFVSSTACIRDFMPLLRLVAPVGRWLGLIPYVSIFSATDLRRSLTAAGFRIDQEWQPKKSSALFVVAVKPA
jgi:ubiquinone/menaquinone biosynthesis C-methylase UbiE